MSQYRGTGSRGLRLTALVMTVGMAIFLCEGLASAQVGAVAGRPAAAGLAKMEPPAVAAPRGEQRTLQPIRDSLSAIGYDLVARQRVIGVSAQTVSPGRRRSLTRRIIGGALAATGGLFAGGFLGAAIEGDRCHCDDPGLQGALIGAPVGAVTGGILGAIFF